jgi:hypothetical protein
MVVTYSRFLVVTASLAMVAMLTGCGADAPTSPSATLDSTPPPAPTALTMTIDATVSGYLLEWTASSASDVAKYQVFQYSPDPSRDNAYVLVGEATAAQFAADAPASAGTETFRVKAVDGAGNHSAFSAALAVPMVPTNTPGLGGGGGSTSGLEKDPRYKIVD